MNIRRIVSKIKTLVIILGGLIATYVVSSAFILPTVLMSKIPEIIQQETGRKASIAKIQIQPFPLSVRLQGFEIQEHSGHSFAAFDVFYIKLGLLQSIKRSALVIDELMLKKPFVHIARQKNGSFNFHDLVKVKAKADNKPVKPQLFPVTIDQMSLADGQLTWEDEGFDNTVKEEFYPINLTVENFTTKADKQARLSLSLALKSGGNMDWKGTVSLTPMASEGHVKLDKVRLETLVALALHNAVPFDLTGYELLAADYKAAYTEKDVQFSVNKGGLEIRDLRFLEKNGNKALIILPVFALQGINVNLAKQAVTIESVSADNADFQAWLNPDGTINYQTLFLPAQTDGNAKTSAAVNAVEPKQSPWSVKINTLTFNNFGLDFEDQTQKKPLAMSFKPINFKLTNYSNEDGAKLPVQLSIGVNNTGLIKLSGDTVIKPLSASLDVDVETIDLKNFQPYYEKFVHLDVIDGALHIDGNLAVAGLGQDNADVKFKGNAGIAHFLTRDQTLRKDLVKWDSLTLTDLEVDLPANRYTATALLIDKPYVRVTIRKDKTVNFNDIVIRDKSKPPTRDKPVKDQPTDGSKPYFKLGKIQVTEGSSDFSDLSLILPFAAQIKSLGGGASGVSSEKKSIMTVALDGNAYDLAPVNIKGKISPYLGEYHVDINFNGLPMPLISPYMVQFAGYKVEKGKLTLGLKYNVVNGELTASNSIFIDQLELGEKVENPNAVSLPLKLAVALLKDSDGKIKIDVPITGSLDDPKFSVGAIVTDALINVLSKVVTSPFRALAALISSEEDMSTVSFPAGNSYLTKQQQAKLDDLAKALKDRPVLNLNIKGAAFVDQDWPVIREDALYELLKGRRADEINKNTDKKIRHEYVELSADDYKRLLADMFIEKFPLLADRSLLGSPRLMNPKAGDFYEIAKQKLFTIIKPEQDRLNQLATARAQTVAKYMVQTAGVPVERLFILDTVIDPDGGNKEVTVALSLTSN